MLWGPIGEGRPGTEFDEPVRLKARRRCGRLAARERGGVGVGGGGSLQNTPVL